MPEEIIDEETIDEEETADEETKAAMEEGETRRAGAFLSPEAFVMLPLAILLDIVGIILVCFGLDDFGTTDAIGLLFIGGWSFFRSQLIGKAPTEIAAPPSRAELKKTTKGTTQVAKWGKRLKWLRPVLICLEFIPYVGCFFWWTLLVIFELKS